MDEAGSGSEDNVKILHNNGISYIDDSVRICRKTNPCNLESNSSEHSDHMYRREPERFNELVKKHFKDPGHYFDSRSEESIQSFLRDYFQIPELILVKLERYENASSGFPYWRFDFWKSNA